MAAPVLSLESGKGLLVIGAAAELVGLAVAFAPTFLAGGDGILLDWAWIIPGGILAGAGSLVALVGLVRMRRAMLDEAGT